MADIRQFKSEFEAAKKGANRCYKKFWASDIHGIFADWLENRDDPRYYLVRNRITNSKAQDQASNFNGEALFNYWDIVNHKFLDKTKIDILVFGRVAPDKDYPRGPYTPPEKDAGVNFCLRWTPFKGTNYCLSMTKEQFNQWVNSFPVAERNNLMANLESHTQTAVAFKESISFDSFEFFIQNEMAGTGAIYDGTKSPDFQWWGAPQSMIRPKKKKKKKS